MRSIYKQVFSLLAFLSLSVGCSNQKKAVNTPTPVNTQTGTPEPVRQGALW
jgi:hypothetical protein